MKLKKKALLYEIANMAYLIADTGAADCHNLHLVRDICQEGNIDRVNRILALAYSKALTVLLPILRPPHKVHDHSQEIPETDGYPITLIPLPSSAPSKSKNPIYLLIKETVHEYLVSMVLADWLEITLPEVAGVWKIKAESSLRSLSETVSGLTSGGTYAFQRKVPW